MADVKTYTSFVDVNLHCFPPSMPLLHLGLHHNSTPPSPSQRKPEDESPEEQKKQRLENGVKSEAEVRTGRREGGGVKLGMACVDG